MSTSIDGKTGERMGEWVTVLFVEAISREPMFLEEMEEGEGSVCIAYRDLTGYHYRQLATSGATLFAIDEPYMREFRKAVSEEFGRAVEMGGGR